MLRLAVLLLLLANAGYFAWSQGLLAPWGIAPAQQAEPQRLAQQIKPQAVRIVGGGDLAGGDSAGAATGAKAGECLVAGVFDESQVGGLRRALESWPAGSWGLESAIEPARWIVYLGKFPSAEVQARTRAELRLLDVPFEALSNPALEPGLSLGAFDTEAAAAQRLEGLVQRGVRNASVVRERAELRGQVLKLPALSDALRPRLDDLKPALAGKALRPCR